MFYFAYGSNLHPLRLTERVPSAELVGPVSLPGYRLMFNKRSDDHSAKCNIIQTASGSDRVLGAIYSIHPEHKHDLDQYEGKGNGYIDNQVSLEMSGIEYHCFTYHAQSSHIDDKLEPYHWYRELVLLGATHLDFPVSYISSIKAQVSIEDPDVARRKKMHELIERMKHYR